MPDPGKKRRAYRNRPTRLNRITEALLGPALAKRGFTHSRLVTEWPAIAGDAAAWSEPANITFPKGKSLDGTLVVNIRSGRGPEMQMMLPGIIERCNAVFGYAAIGRITLTQVSMEGASARPSAPPPASADDGEEQDDPGLPGDVAASPELRETLASLGRSVRRRQGGGGRAGR